MGEAHPTRGSRTAMIEVRQLFELEDFGDSPVLERFRENGQQVGPRLRSAQSGLRAPGARAGWCDRSP